MKIYSMRLLATGFVFFLSGVLYARSSNAKNFVRVSDTMPGLSSAKIINNGEQALTELNAGDVLPKDAATLVSRYKGKLIVLDFWNIWCSYCIQSMPELERLQQRYHDKVQIILVTSNTKAQVNKLQSHNQILKNVHLPIVTDDTILSAYFPSVTFPTHVWVDSNNLVLQKTNGYNTTAGAIQTYLRGKTVTLAQKKELIDFNINTPLWEEGNGRQRTHFKYYSLITESIDYSTHSGMSRLDSASKKMVWLHLINYTLFDLYKFALIGKYGIGYDAFNSRCIIQSKNSSFIKPSPGNDINDFWIKNNSWCYELQVPPEKAGNFYDFMLTDLNRFFNLNYTNEKLPVKCLVIKLIRQKNIPATGIKRRADSLPNYEWESTVKNKVVTKGMLSFFQRAFPDKIVVDCTNYTGVINFSFTQNPKDLITAKQALNPNGFDLVEETKLINIITIKDFH